MGNGRLRLDVQSPVGKVGRVKKAMKHYEKSFVEFFWYLWDMFEHNPQMYNLRLKDKLVRYSNLYEKDIQTLIELSIDEWVENNPVKFEYGKEKNNPESSRSRV